MFLQPPGDSAENARLYKSDLDQLGYVMNLTRAWAWRPDVCDGFSALRTLLTSRSSLTAREVAVLVCSTAASLGDSYCALAWGKRLAAESNPATAAAVLQGAHDALGVRERALARWARNVVMRANATGAQDLDELRTAGLSEQEIFEATTFIAFRIAFSTVNDALGVRPDWQLTEAVPPEVRAAVTFGRASAERDPPPASSA
jgi:uncharacterized peroxidase-related enzyme